MRGHQYGGSTSITELARPGAKLVPAVAHGPWRKGVRHEHRATAEHVDEVFPCHNRGLWSVCYFFVFISSKSRCAENGERVADVEVWDAISERSLREADELRLSHVVAHLCRVFTEASIGCRRGMCDTGFAGG